MAVSMGLVIAMIKSMAADPSVIASAVDAWLDDHPEATTTVEDGSITYEKLASALADVLDGKYEKPSGGIPASDIANGVIPDVSGKQDAPSAAGTAGQVLGLDDSLNPVWTNKGGGGGGSSDYTDLSNKPQINSVTLTGNKSLSDLGVTVSVVTPDSGDTFTLDPCPVTYNFGEKAELTVTVTATSQYHFMFSCPSGTTTVLTITGETYRMGDTLEAGESYEVDVWAGITRVSKLDGSAVT